MKILKIRRGYTTNSSAASEFIPPDAEVVVLTPQSGAASGKSPLASVQALNKPETNASKQSQTANPADAKPAKAKPASTQPKVIPIKPMPAASATADTMQAPAPAVPTAPQAATLQEAKPAMPEVTPAPATPAAPPKSRGENNSILIGTLAALVAAAFAAERLLRRVFRRKDQDSED